MLLTSIWMAVSFFKYKLSIAQAKNTHFYMQVVSQMPRQFCKNELDDINSNFIFKIWIMYLYSLLTTYYSICVAYWCAIHNTFFKENMNDWNWAFLTRMTWIHLLGKMSDMLWRFLFRQHPKEKRKNCYRWSI